MSSGKILIADDTATYRAMLGDALSAKGYDIVYAGDGLETVKIVKEEIKDLKLVLLDLLMPKMLGFDVLKEIREMEGGERLPVVVITGLFKNIDDIRRVKSLGAAGFIDKALPIEEVVFRIENIIKSSQAPQEKSAVVRVDLLVNYKINDEPFSAYTFLVSRRGLFLRSTKPLPVGSEMHLSFELGEGGRQIECDAVVTRTVTAEDKKELVKYPQGMEVQFTHILPADLAHLAAWVEERASAGGKSTS